MTEQQRLHALLLCSSIVETASKIEKDLATAKQAAMKDLVTAKSATAAKQAAMEALASAKQAAIEFAEIVEDLCNLDYSQADPRFRRRDQP